MGFFSLFHFLQINDCQCLQVSMKLSKIVLSVGDRIEVAPQYCSSLRKRIDVQYRLTVQTKKLFTFLRFASYDWLILKMQKNC